MKRLAPSGPSCCFGIVTADDEDNEDKDERDANADGDKHPRPESDVPTGTGDKREKGTGDDTIDGLLL